LYIYATRTFTAFSRHIALPKFYFTQNAIYFVILSISVQVMCFLISHILQCKYQRGCLKVKTTLFIPCTEKVV